MTSLLDRPITAASDDFSNVYSSLKSLKITKKTLFWGFKVVQIIDVGTPGKLDRQQCLL